MPFLNVLFLPNKLRVVPPTTSELSKRNASVLVRDADSVDGVGCSGASKTLKVSWADGGKSRYLMGSVMGADQLEQD